MKNLSNEELLKSIIGSTIIEAFEEQYYFENKLDDESMGNLQLNFSNHKKITFECHQDAESLLIQEGEFFSKSELEKDYSYKWEIVPYRDKNLWNKMGKIINCYIETIHNGTYKYQGGCKLNFENGDYLYVWTMGSDNLFFGLNSTPKYHKKEGLKITLDNL